MNFKNFLLEKELLNIYIYFENKKTTHPWSFNSLIHWFVNEWKIIFGRKKKEKDKQDSSIYPRLVNLLPHPFEKRLSKVVYREKGVYPKGYPRGSIVTLSLSLSLTKSPSSPLHGSRWEEAGRLENRFKPAQLILTFSFRFAKFPDSFSPPPPAYQEGIRPRKRGRILASLLPPPLDS